MFALSTGSGRQRIMLSSNASIPIPSRAEPANTGINLLARDAS